MSCSDGHFFYRYYYWQVTMTINIQYCEASCPTSTHQVCRLICLLSFFLKYSCVCVCVLISVREGLFPFHAVEITSYASYRWWEVLRLLTVRGRPA